MTAWWLSSSCRTCWNRSPPCRRRFSKNWRRGEAWKTRSCLTDRAQHFVGGPSWWPGYGPTTYQRWRYLAFHHHLDQDACQVSCSMEAGELEHASRKEERGEDTLRFICSAHEGISSARTESWPAKFHCCYIYVHIRSGRTDDITWSLAFTELQPTSQLELTTVCRQPSREGQLINVPGSLRTGRPGCLLFKAWTWDAHGWIRLVIGMVEYWTPVERTCLVVYIRV